MTHTVKSLKALLREYKHLHSFAYSKMKKHELYAIALKLGLINEDSLDVKKVKKEKVKRIKKVKNDKVIVDNDREKLKQNINNLIISEQLKHETKKKELKSIMDKYDYETKKIDRALIKKDSALIKKKSKTQSPSTRLYYANSRLHSLLVRTTGYGIYKSINKLSYKLAVSPYFGRKNDFYKSDKYKKWTNTSISQRQDLFNRIHDSGLNIKKTDELINNLIDYNKEANLTIDNIDKNIDIKGEIYNIQESDFLDIKIFDQILTTYGISNIGDMYSKEYDKDILIEVLNKLRQSITDSRLTYTNK